MSAPDATRTSTGADLIARAREVVRIEAAAVAALEGRLDDTFVRAVETLAACRGKVIVSGVGKSGLIAHKLAATLTSTGTPAVFLHPPRCSCRRAAAAGSCSRCCRTSSATASRSSAS
jgi:DNA-binding MurR/RpiR family transcriptional regulator